MALSSHSKKTESLLLTDQLKTEVADKSTQAQNFLSKSFNDYKNICFATSMGAEDMVIYDLINKMNRTIEIFTLDTGRLHAETYELISHVNSNFKNKIKIFFPDASEIKKYVDNKGINDFYNSLDSRKECCRIRKIEPLKKALKGHDAWITGLRAEQSITRSNQKLNVRDSNFEIDKISPLLNWKEDEIWAYIKINHVPYNKLHDHFFPSIGCQPCTRAISLGEDIRAGRWWWENPENKECGLNQKQSI
jgi:phosphoadenosine phosphosulfate reductase